MIEFLLFVVFGLIFWLAMRAREISLADRAYLAFTFS